MRRHAPQLVRVRATRGFCLGGGRDVFEGDEFELDLARATQKAREGYVQLLGDEDDAGSTEGRESGRPRAAGGSREGRNR